MFLVARFGLSQRRVCQLVALDRNTWRYRSRRQEDATLRTRIREMAETKRRYGCPRIYGRLRREGWRVTIRRWNGSIIARNGSRYGGEEGRRPRPFHESPCRDRFGPGSVMRWTSSMTGWPLADGSSV